PLVAEQELRVRPALVLLPDELISRHPDVVEEHLVDLVPAVNEPDRADGHTGRVHVDEQERDAALLRRLGVGAGQAEDPVRVLREGRPGLLAVDDVVLTVAYGRGP